MISQHDFIVLAYPVQFSNLPVMINNLTVAPAAIIVMALVGVFTLILPLGLGIFFWRKSNGRWRFFLIGWHRKYKTLH